jgi:hypothetical protein
MWFLRLGTSRESDSKSVRKRTLGGAFPVAIFGVHVLELTGLEDLAALQALDELAVFVPRDDLHPRVRAGTLRSLVLVGSGGARRW